ncbi:D-alanyl-D-alanine carboxypeptidase [Cohnella fermenti]|uniref:D-alanyl-D-alanine carboxypeptidase n=2 Tax=Cohnella fermenti TaxID=2565925 RepID=A0A4S4C215_9BACL|nr:D-alanyl-D-alanine carboxypeptidase [Cohnella fermenti]
MLCILSLGIGLALIRVPTGFAEEAELTALPIDSESAILIDADSGVVLYGKNPEVSMFPASIAKIVTAIIAIEEGTLTDIVTVSKEARYEEGTRVYLAEGEQVTLEKLVYGLMVNSGNDAATAIAEHLDGSKDAFAERMNRFVREQVGVRHTTFTNPSGLPDPNMVTTAEDMALIARYAMGNETFRKVVSTQTLPWNGEEWQTELINHNRMLWDYEGATGVKNGYTTAAGNTLVTSATRDGVDLIAVVLKASGSKQAYADTTKLLDYGFGAFYSKTFLQTGETFVREDDEAIVEWKAERAVAALVPSGSDPAFEVNASGEVLIESPYGGQVAGRLVEASRSEKADPEQVAVPAGEAEATASMKESGRGGEVSGLVAASVGLLMTAGWIRKRRVRRRRQSGGYGGYREDRWD